MRIHSLSEGAEGHANEDFVDYRAHPEDAAVMLCALADGQGGQPGGAEAARVAVSFVLDSACAASPRDLLVPSTWLDLCGAADRRVNATRDAGYCTLVTLAVTREWVVGASWGDGGAVLVLEKSSAVLTERQRKGAPVGSGGARFEPFSARLGGWWRILVLSDGAWKYAGWDRAIRIARDERTQDLPGALRREVRARAGGFLSDDFSVVAVEP